MLRVVFDWPTRGSTQLQHGEQDRTCVVKEQKDSYTWKATDWDMTVEIQQEAQKMAEEFNKFSGTDHPIQYTDVVVHQVTKSTGRPKLNEYVVVEDYIPGSYKKWINNYGLHLR